MRSLIHLGANRSAVCEEALVTDGVESDVLPEVPEQPVTLDSIPDETTSAFSFDAQCSCFLRTGLKSRTAEELLGQDLSDGPHPEHCDQRGMQDCIQYCNTEVKLLTNDLDLEKVPVTRSNVDVSLGQYMCNMLGSQIIPSRVSVSAKLTCSAHGPRHEAQTVHVATTGLSSKQRLFCFRGKFRPT